ncbi:hypothetical protein J2Z75_003131 [Rhizobium herbae]|uniref:Uncharacterized protein n=1 Tax=Rhizobium herbae TaxID=508661 RepID=A0ABS4ENT7_9HYPH|nr:hypothetical protein [Rhizobium herbae]
MSEGIAARVVVTDIVKPGDNDPDAVAAND